MRTNPFKFGKEVSGRQFYDRKDAFNELHRKLSGGASNVVMYAPRRYGKTSLVKKVLARFNEEGFPTVYFDFNRVDSLERFCEEYASSLYALGGRGGRLVDAMMRYLSHLHPTVGIGADALVEVKFDYGDKMTSTSVSSVLDFAEKMAAETLGKPLIVAFDEFQEIARLSSKVPLEGVFRSCIQAHQNVRYLFFGSKSHLLKRMFGEKTRPFYKSAATLRLQKPPEVESVEFVKSMFASCGMGIDDTEAKRIVSEAENVPYYVQQLSSIVFDLVVEAGRDWVEDKDIDRAVDDVTMENSDYYVERMAALSTSQRLVVSAIARERTSDFTEPYRRRHLLGSSSTVHTALKVAVEAGVIERSAEGYSLEDPFFARYLRTSAAKAGLAGNGKEGVRA